MLEYQKQIDTFNSIFDPDQHSILVERGKCLVVCAKCYTLSYIIYYVIRVTQYMLCTMIRTRISVAFFFVRSGDGGAISFVSETLPAIERDTRYDSISPKPIDFRFRMRTIFLVLLRLFFL